MLCDVQEAFNTAKWQGYAASPAVIGNVLFPPYGNAGNENYLLIQPKTGATTTSGGSSASIIAAVIAGVVVIAIVVFFVVRGRRQKSMEE